MPSHFDLPGSWPVHMHLQEIMWPVVAWTTSAPFTTWKPARGMYVWVVSSLDIQVYDTLCLFSISSCESDMKFHINNSSIDSLNIRIPVLLSLRWWQPDYYKLWGYHLVSKRMALLKLLYHVAESPFLGQILNVGKMGVWFGYFIL